VLIEVAACVLLVWRRRNPLLFATLSTAVLLAMPWVGPQLYEPSVPVMIWAVSIFALGRWLPDLRGLAGVAVCSSCWCSPTTPWWTRGSIAGRM
jgi:hypothetical protein